jgi:hypothetical protein
MQAPSTYPRTRPTEHTDQHRLVSEFCPQIAQIDADPGLEGQLGRLWSRPTLDDSRQQRRAWHRTRRTRTRRARFSVIPSEAPSRRRDEGSPPGKLKLLPGGDPSVRPSDGLTRDDREGSLEVRLIFERGIHIRVHLRDLRFSTLRSRKALSHAGLIERAGQPSDRCYYFGL